MKRTASARTLRLLIGVALLLLAQIALFAAQVPTACGAPGRIVTSVGKQGSRQP